MRPIGLYLHQNLQEVDRDGSVLPENVASGVGTLDSDVSNGNRPSGLGTNARCPGYSVATPRPISPAEGTTNPSAQATQSQNPYLGSVPSENTGMRIELTLKNAIERGLRFNLLRLA
jgi:hypothetical protein